MRFDHIMIQTDSVENSSEFYEIVFEMKIENRDFYDDFELCYMVNEETNIKFELREVYAETQPARGGPVGHFAFYVDSMSEIEKRIIENFPDLEYNTEHHVSKVHGKEYKILTVISPEGCEMSALEKVVG